MRPIRNNTRLSVAILCLGFASCVDPDRLSITREGRETRLVNDSPEVERMLSIRKVRDTEAEKLWSKHLNREEATNRVSDAQVNPEHYAPGRKEFLMAMSQEPGVLVPEKTYVRVLAGSGAMCNLEPVYTFTFVKVRITSGPLRGREGWACQWDVPGVYAMP